MKIKRDDLLLVFTSLLALFFAYEIVFVNNIPGYAVVYLALYAFIVGVIVLTRVFKKNGVFDYRLFGNISLKDMKYMIYIFVILITALIIMNNIPETYSLIPLSVTELYGNNILLISFIAVLLAPIFEELAFRGTLSPTLMKIFKSGVAVSLVFLVFGIILLTENQIFLAVVLFAIAMLFFFFKKASRFIFDDQLHFTLMVAFSSAFIFALFHGYAYGGVSDINLVLSSAFIFGIIAEIIDELYGSTIPSIFLHTGYNAVTISFLYKSFIPFIFVFIVFFAIWICFKRGFADNIFGVQRRGILIGR